MSADCLFCKFGRGEIPVGIVLQEERWLAFDDIQPQAPVHTLLIPRRHIATLDDAGEDDRELLGELLAAAPRVAAAKGLGARGYRTVINCRAEAGQSVFHLHVHVLGGRPMTWPPG